MADKNVITLKITPEFLNILDELEKADVKRAREAKKRIADENPDQCLPCIVDPDMNEVVKILGKEAIPYLNKIWAGEDPNKVAEELQKRFPDKMERLAKLADKFRLQGV